MPTDPFLPEDRQFPRNSSPDNGPNSRKRRRKVLSCYDCRKRKLQCDRALPACGRCTKAGQAAQCLYLDDASEAPVREPDTQSTSASSIGKAAALFGQNSRAAGVGMHSGDLVTRLEYQDGRIKQLEAALAATGQNVKLPRIPPTPESMPGTEIIAPVQDRERTLLRGRSFKTQFHGNTHPGALIAQIPELQGFSREIFESYPALSRIKEDVQSLEKRVRYAGTEHGSVSDEDLRALLSDKAEADHLIQTYLDSFDIIYHIIHLPSFWEEYSRLWTVDVQPRPHFVALVLVMMAAAQCLSPVQRWLYTASSSIVRERAVLLIHSVESWLLAQSQKHVTAADFQIRIILLIARQVVARKFKRAWTEAGNVLRFCMAAGLHRTPDLIKKQTSLLDKELRKRIWATATELELQAAFDRGMISTPWQLQCDCPAPSHLHDDDLDGTTEHMPASRKRNDLNGSSYLCVAHESIMLRQNLNTYLNNVRQPVCFEESKRFTEEIDAYLQAIPDWTEASSQIPAAMLSLNLRQYLLVLHDRQLRVCESRTEKDFSRMILVDSCSKILQTHQSLISKGIHSLELLCQDQLRAALSLGRLASMDPHADDALSRVITETANVRIPEAIDMLTDKVARFGREQRQLWILVAATAFMKTRNDPGRKAVYMQEAVDKVTRPYYKIMASQQDAEEQVTSTRQGQAQKNCASAQNPITPLIHDKTDDMPTADPPLLDLDEIAAWTFEDWGFDAGNLTAPFSDPGNFINDTAFYPPT